VRLEAAAIVISPGELVTVSITAVNTHYLAIFGDLLHADWTIVQPLHQVRSTVPGDTRLFMQETRSFIAMTGPGSDGFSIQSDFVRNAQNQPNAGAAYEIVIAGSVGPFRIQKQIFPIPPFPIVRPFMFEVRP